MGFDHNDHYHRLLLRHVPPGARSALDVGCGTGAFARRLAVRGIAVRAVERDAQALGAARAAEERAPLGIRYEHGDVQEMALPPGRYDVVTCLASLHHMPFGTVTALRDALAPGGVLLVLGCYAERSRADMAFSLLAVPVNAAARVGVWAAERFGLRRHVPSTVAGVRAPVVRPTTSLADVRREAAVLLPGASVRRLLFWRYLLVHRAAR